MVIPFVYVWLHGKSLLFTAIYLISYETVCSCSSKQSLMYMLYLFGGGAICKKVNIPLSQIMYYAQYHPTIITTSFGFEFFLALHFH